MSFRLLLDTTKCQGYANCLIEAPSLWGFDEDADRAVLLVRNPDESFRDKAVASARCCPARAIEMTEHTA